MIAKISYLILEEGVEKRLISEEYWHYTLDHDTIFETLFYTGIPSDYTDYAYKKVRGVNKSGDLIFSEYYRWNTKAQQLDCDESTTTESDSTNRIEWRYVDYYRYNDKEMNGRSIELITYTENGNIDTETYFLYKPQRSEWEVRNMREYRYNHAGEIIETINHNKLEQHLKTPSIINVLN